MGHYVYKYVYNDEVIYVGKTDVSIRTRISQHGKPGDNIDECYWNDINESDVYAIELPNSSITDFVETCLINQYQPKCNKAKMLPGFEDCHMDCLIPEDDWELIEKRNNKIQDKHYIQLNIGEYKDYLDTMSKYYRRPKTKYILNLIKEDAKKRQEEYEAIKNIERIRGNRL